MGANAWAGTLAYAAFDLLWLTAAVGPLDRAPCFEEGRELFEAACRLDLEGIVAKRKADPYRPETVWYKVKNPPYT